MSFILDALKKSENERQGGAALGSAEVAVARDAPRAPGWIWWLIALLGVNLVVLTTVLLRPEQDSTGAAAEPAAATQADSAPADRPPVATPRAESTPAMPATVAGELAAVVDQARSEREAEPEPPIASARPVAAGPAPIAATPMPAPAAADEPLTLPTLDELRARGETQLPELHVDIHVYSAVPAERFVYVNTRKYREGEELSEGPRVHAIVEQGVVLQHRGARFLLPRE